MFENTKQLGGSDALCGGVQPSLNCVALSQLQATTVLIVVLRSVTAAAAAAPPSPS